jgi:hypothetical protein
MSNIEKKPFIQRIDKKIRIAAAGVVLAASLGMGMEACTNQPDKPGIATTISGETAQPRLTSENWMTIPQDQIADYATAPQLGLNILDKEKYLSTVSPALQEKAQAVGYTIIYQGDPNDTTGRSVIAEDRQTDGEFDPLREDTGFGESMMGINGVFKAWVVKPSDPQQQNEIYALLENPLTQKSYLVDISLRVFDPSYKAQPTYFLVDNLDKGYKDIAVVGNEPASITAFLSDNPNDPNKYKDPASFPTFNDLLNKDEINLDSIAKPGDYITTITQGSLGKGNAKDENGVAKINDFIVRRFGGTAEWNQEVGIK